MEIKSFPREMGRLSLLVQVGMLIVPAENALSSSPSPGYLNTKVNSPVEPSPTEIT